jgi:hypothetical protein
MTAVDFLMDKLFDPSFDNKKQIEWFEQAKEMEKQQIIEAHGYKQRLKSNPNSIVTYGYTYNGEMYYNDKFNK